MPTLKALKEVQSLNSKIQTLETDLEQVRKDLMRGSLSLYHSKALRKELNSIDRKIWNAKDKIKTISEFGISTSEQTYVKQNTFQLKCVDINRCIGVRTSTHIGFLEKFNSYVCVRITKYTDIMSNVQGCKSLAGKKEIDNLEFMDEAKAQELIQSYSKKQLIKSTI